MSLNADAARDRGVRGALVAIAVSILLAACGTSPKRPGGYYKDDGPGASPPKNVESTPDAAPRVEPLHKSANNPYTVFGRHYVPAKTLRPYKERGIASWYGKKFHGQMTSSGERYDMYKMTAAHTTLPIPSYARVTNLKNGRSVIVRINDRGPFHSGRIIDLSYAAAAKLGYVNAGSAPVEVEALLPGEMSRAAEEQPAASAAPVEAPPAVAAEALPAEAIPAAPDAKGVYLQLGAFSARDNADALRGRLERELSWVDRSFEVLPVDGLFRVRLGPYRDRGEADGVALRIREALDLKPVVIER
ncbi:MAG TPA: septal ring lytic transglycosylase RlpA family protein [Burkholderiales bacterium]